MHRLLLRQLKRANGSQEAAPQDWASFLDSVDAQYTTADDDLARVERSLDLMSQELNERNAYLQTEIEQRRIIEEQLKTTINRLKRKNEQITELNAMGEKLQSCRNLDNAYHIIAGAMQKLFFTEAGMISIHDPQSGTLLSVATWGDGVAPHEAATENPEVLTSAQDGDPGAKTPARVPHHLRLQLSTHGQPLGMVHVLLKADSPDQVNDTSVDEREQLVQTTSDHISLALSNLKLQESLRQQTIRDALTGLYNRRHMEVSLEREACRALRSGKPLGIIMLDVDHFKRVNDTFGHLAGDAVLAALGTFLSQQVRGEDIACRYGGEEFILILPEADLENTRRRAGQLCQEVPHALNLEFEGQTLGQITISLGVAVFPGHGLIHHDVIRAADAALYEAKRRGRNQVVAADLRDGPPIAPAPHSGSSG